jgi:hypothetical protein
VPPPALCQASITDRMQTALLRREEILHSSETAFSRSRRLLEKMRDLHGIVKPRQYNQRGDSRQT